MGQGIPKVQDFALAGQRFTDAWNSTMSGNLASREKIKLGYLSFRLLKSELFRNDPLCCLPTKRHTRIAAPALERAHPAPMIDSMFNDDDAARQRKLSEIRAFMKAYRAQGNLILVTHDVNIRALVGEAVAQGDMVLATIRPNGSLAMVGMLILPPG